MQFLAAFGLISTVSASAIQMSARIPNGNPLLDLAERQLTVCKPVPPGPNACARACGPGNVQCVTASNCYNPSQGEVCCSNGKYCPAGEYCTDGGCCPDGMSLEDCGATVTLSVLPPPVESTAAPEPSSTSEEPAPEPEPTSSEDPPVSEEPTVAPEPTVSAEPTLSVPTVVPQPTTTALPTSTHAPPTNGTIPTPGPIPTGAATSNAGNAAIALGAGLFVHLLLL